MFEYLCIATGLVLAVTAMIAYWRWRDAFHPAVVMAPTFGYMLCITPLVLNGSEGLEAYFSRDELEYVQLIYLLAVVFFSIGLLSARPRWSSAVQFSLPMVKRLYQVAIVMGMISVAVYFYMIENVGGFVEAYSRVKGGGRAGSGYIAEAILLSYPAVLFGAIACRIMGRIGPRDILLAILIMMPHLLQGTFGGRRGPLILALTVLFFAWLIARGELPSLKKIIVFIAAIGLAAIFVSSQRKDVYIGSSEGIAVERFWDKLIPDSVEPGDTYVYGAAKIIEADYYQSYNWGYRYFVTFFIRPIPRQIWPTKYQDMGASWVRGVDDEEGRNQMLEAVGFETPAGSSLPSIADVYVEFSWGVLPFFLLLGRLFARIWTLHRERGGVWSIIHCVMLALSIYLATQSFSAWATRLLYIVAITFVLWKYWIAQRGGSRTPVTQGMRSTRLGNAAVRSARS